MGKGIEDAILSQIIKNHEKMNVYMKPFHQIETYQFKNFVKKLRPKE